MKTLLLCGYRTTDENEAGLGLEQDADGRTLIDRRIATLHELGLTVVCVLSGDCADEQLRNSRGIAQSELIFDHVKPVSLFGNVRAGIDSLNGEACFVLPVEVPPPALWIWDFLRNEYAKVGFNTAQSVIQALPDPQGAPWHFGFPLLFTRQGCQNVQNTANLNSLVDTRLKYLHLAPETKPL